MSFGWRPRVGQDLDTACSVSWGIRARAFPVFPPSSLVSTLAVLYRLLQSIAIRLQVFNANQDV